ncbi:MAG: transcription-repair coupling factor [Bacillota bacterium]|nr:transcription-repair coupling factor [Bacillota bacterium]
MTIGERPEHGGPGDLLRLWDQAPEFGNLVQKLREGPTESLAYGLSGSEKTFLVAGLLARVALPCLYLTASIQQAERIAADLGSLLPAAHVLVFPQLDILPYDIIAQGREVAADRLRVLETALNAASSGTQLVVVAPLTAVTRKLPPAAGLAGLSFQLRPGDDYDMAEITGRLVRAGYERVASAEVPGHFAVRGGILDVYPAAAAAPVRAEFLGDRLESLRGYDPATQRSVGPAGPVTVFAASEFLPGEERLGEACRRIAVELERMAGDLVRRERPLDAEKLRQRVGEHVERLRAGDVKGLEQYLAYCYGDAATFLDYLPEQALVVMDEPARLKESVDGQLALHRERYAALLEAGATLPAQADVVWEYPQLLARARRTRLLHFSLVMRRTGIVRPDHLLSLTARPMTSFHGQWELLSTEIQRLRADGRTVAVLVANEGRASRLRDALQAEGIEVISAGAWATAPRPATLVLVGAVEAGFEVPALKLALITEGEISGRPVRRPRARPFREGLRVSSHLDLKVGDWVVHINHGIGRYVGVTSLEVEGVRRDYLFLKYAGEDRLYVPTDQVDSIQRYVGGEGHEPKLNRLGGTEWSRTKNKVRESVREMARELIALYAAREVGRGHAFATDTAWQNEFEEAFPFEETPHQLTSTFEIKRDMEDPRPMDRLLCGDVGYGKTEVAVRAAFKAVMDGKQVAVLVPTTILAQQHFNTFRERFASFPVSIELLSRFRSPGQQRRTVAGLRSGRVDIVIGTHRLLSEDIAFHALGLLVIDEEHRFGVAQKERIKQWRQTVDVLTLSATPIPRTLHMALAGVRHMSVIETPPEDRFPVQTYVVEHSDILVRDAILRELARGGQVFYVHNRVRTIEGAASRVARLVPEARIAIGHGQMAEDHLEQVMVGFLEREFDILVCTTIIESGLDIANVNTLIVEDADHLGLAQLYQLRGRVGRSSRLAYAYLTYRRDKLLTEEAELRLDAVRQFTELGSGFKIAMRDLEIRGMGNLLGAEQHGFVAAVGLDLYVRLLHEAVDEMRGEVKAEEAPQASVEIAVDAFVPEDYVPDPGEKVAIYRRLAGARTLAAVDEMHEELADRYGVPPAAVSNLLAVARLRVLATRCGLISVVQSPEGIRCRFGNPRALSGERLVNYVHRNRARLSLRVKKGIELRISVPRHPHFGPAAAAAEPAGENALRIAVETLEALNHEAVF